MTTSPNRRDARRIPHRQDRARMQGTYDKVARGVARAQPLVAFVILVLQAVDAWQRCFG
ncbi:MAG: hypothetical protein ACRDS9_03445 [Pseudonocardiaceae bacterium]